MKATEPASSTGFSKAKQARILTREEGSRASAERERGDWKRARSASGVKYPPDERSRATGDEAATEQFFIEMRFYLFILHNSFLVGRFVAKQLSDMYMEKSKVQLNLARIMAKILLVCFSFVSRLLLLPKITSYIPVARSRVKQISRVCLVDGLQAVLVSPTDRRGPGEACE